MSNAIPKDDVNANDPIGLLASLHGRSSKHLRRALTGYAIAKTGWGSYKKVQTWYRAKFEYSISIMSTEDIYGEVKERLLSILPEEDRRSIFVSSIRTSSGGMKHVDDYESSPTPISYAESPDPVKKQSKLISYYDGESTQTLTINGYPVEVCVIKDESMKDKRDWNAEKIKFTVHSKEAQEALLDWIADLVDERNEAPVPRLMILSQWGSGWERRSDMTPRSLESVILRKGQIEEIVEDIQTFLGWHDDYLRFGIPYHRGYLFHGPPGTGKTSLAKAVAAHFGLDVYYAPLSDMDKDTNFLYLVSQVKTGSVLLLEDVDVLNAAQDRGDDDDDKKGLSLSGLLNALDGVSTPNGIITIMTTNRIDVLDKALIRPGRVDRIMEIDYLDNEQFDRLISMVFGKPVSLGLKLGVAGKQISPAEVYEVMKRHLHDPESGLPDLKKMIKKRGRK